MNRKKLLTVGVAALIAALGTAGASAAWLTLSTSADNSMTPATVAIQVHEEQSRSPAEAGTSVTKTVTVKNLPREAGGPPRTYAYIRVAIVPVWRNADGTGAGLPADNLNLTVRGEGWAGKTSADGFFYYYFKNPVKPGESTKELTITCTPTDLTDAYAGKKLEITVLASAVQAVGDAKYEWLPTDADSLLEPLPTPAP